MTDDRLERLLVDLLADAAPSAAPDRLAPETIRAARRVRRWPRWLAFVKEPPMRISSRVAVGSPTLRLAYLAFVSLLLVVLATGAVAGAASLLPGPATIIVAADGSGDYATITDGIAVARDGDTVLVRPGTYPESVRILAGITLKGDGPPGSIILDFRATTARTDVPYPDRPLPYGVIVDGGDPEVSGLTFLGPAEGIGVQVLAGTPTLIGLVIPMGDASTVRDEVMPVGFFGRSGGVVRDSTLGGYIPVRGGSPQFLENTISGAFSIDGPGAPVLRENHFLQDSGAGMSYGGNPIIEGNEFDGGGIGVDTGSDPRIRLNVFSGEPASSGWVDCAAICVAQYREVMSADELAALGVTEEDLGEISAAIEDNEMSTAAVAIAVKGDGASPVISHNIVRDSVTGITIESLSTATVQDNTFTRNGSAILVSGGESVISRNDIQESSATGLSINSGTSRVTGNHIESGTVGIALGGAAEPVLADNVVCGNEVDITRLGDAVASLEGVDICEESPTP